MADAYGSVVTGKLSLKGKLLKTDKKKRKKKKSKKHTERHKRDASAAHLGNEEHDHKRVELLPVDETPYTQAELKYMAVRKQKEEEEIKKNASVSHREKLEKLNEALEALPIHNDVPKVAAAGLG